MELPQKGKKYVIILQDHLTKWPLVCVVPNQKTQTVARVLVEQLVPEALLLDRGTNLFSSDERLVQDAWDDQTQHNSLPSRMRWNDRTVRTNLKSHVAQTCC